MLRFDLVPTFFTVMGLTFFSGSAVLIGALVGFGFMVKVWPAALLLAESNLRRLAVEAATAAAVSLVLVIGLGLAFGDPLVRNANAPAEMPRESSGPVPAGAAPS